MRVVCLHEIQSLKQKCSELARNVEISFFFNLNDCMPGWKCTMLQLFRSLYNVPKFIQSLLVIKVLLPVSEDLFCF